MRYTHTLLRGMDASYMPVLVTTSHHWLLLVECLPTDFSLLLLVCVSWTITGQPQNSVFSRRV